MRRVTSSLQGTVVSISVQAGDVVSAGTLLCLVESMKMHHEITAPEAGAVSDVLVVVGATVAAGDPLMTLTPQTPISTADLVQNRVRSAVEIGVLGARQGVAASLSVK